MKQGSCIYLTSFPESTISSVEARQVTQECLCLLVLVQVESLVVPHAARLFGNLRLQYCIWEAIVTFMCHANDLHVSMC